MVNSFWQSVDSILEDVFVTETVIQRLSSVSVFKNYCSPTCVTKWKVEPNMADPISLNKKRLLP